MMEGWRVLVRSGVLQHVDPGTAAGFLKASPPGAYTTTRTSGGVVLLWERHVARLLQSVSLLADELPALYPGARSSPGLDPGAMWKSALDGLIDSSMRAGMARACELREDGEEVAVTVLACGSGVVSASEIMHWTCDCSVHFSRYRPALPTPPAVRVAVMGPGRSIPHAKFSAWVRDRQVFEQARPQDVSEIVLSNDGDMLLEGSITNFFVVASSDVKQGVESKWAGIEVQTAPLDAGVLPGVVRQQIIEICQKEGIPLREVPPSWSKRDTWVEAFITSSLRLVQPVMSVVHPVSWSISSEFWSRTDWHIHHLQGDGRLSREFYALVQAHAQKNGLPVSSFL